MAKSSLPELVSLLVCESASRDPGSGKVTLYGVFDNLNLEALPGSATFFTYAKLHGGDGTHKIEFQLLGPDGKPTSDNPPTFDIECKKNENRDVGIFAVGIMIKKSGAHRLRVKIDGRAIGQPYVIFMRKIARR